MYLAQATLTAQQAAEIVLLASDWPSRGAHDSLDGADDLGVHRPFLILDFTLRPEPGTLGGPDQVHRPQRNLGFAQVVSTNWSLNRQAQVGHQLAPSGCPGESARFEIPPAQRIFETGVSNQVEPAFAKRPAPCDGDIVPPRL